jgi:hypothetical protein
MSDKFKEIYSVAATAQAQRYRKICMIEEGNFV